KMLFRAAGLTTPEFQVIDSLPAPTCRLRWPVILKPASEDASVGLDQGSVVTDQTSFARRAAWLFEQFQAPGLAEEFIAGRELNVGLKEGAELQILPISEIVFSGGDRWPIVTYDAKWAYGSVDDLSTVPRCPADVDPALAERIGQAALRAFRLTGC